MTTRRALLTGAAAAGLFISFRPGNAQADDLPPAPTPEQWAKSPTLQNVCMSPDGNHVAYISETPAGKVLYDLDIAARQTKSFNIGKVKVAGLSWVDNAHVALTTHTVDKFDEYAGGQHTYLIVTIYNLQAASIVSLFTRMANFKGFVLAGSVQVINYKGKIQLTGASKQSDADDATYLYRFELDTERGTPMDRGPQYTLDWVVTPEGELVGRSSYDFKTRLWTLDYMVGNTWKTIYTRTVDLNWPELAGLGRDGKSLVVYLPSSETEGDYVEMAGDGAASAPLFDDDERRAPLFDAVTRRLAGTVSFATGWPQYSYFDPAAQALVTKAQAAVEGYRMSIIDRADDPHKMIVYSEGDDDAGTYYYFDFNTGKAGQVGLAYPDIPTQWITAKTAIHYKAADGLDIEAYLTLPPNRPSKDLPLIVLPHGGPEGDDDGSFDWQVQAFASLGYAVLQPNYRGSTRYGQAFIDAGHGQWGKKMQTDLSDGVRELVKQGVADAKRVAIVGASYGGYAALAGAALDTGVYRCAIDIAGISDLKSFLFWVIAAEAYEQGPRTRYWKRYLADEDLDAISPIRHVDRINIPVMIVHGKADTVVPYDQSVDMANAMKAAGKPVEFVTFTGQDHWETDEASRIEMMTHIARFLKANLPA